MTFGNDSIAIIGAGMGGLAAGIRLAAAGRDVTIFDSHGWPGGKMRTVASQAGPVDAGPTVLTLRDVLDDLFATAGTTTSDQITLKALPILARHYWSDSTTLDLTHDAGQNSAAIAAAFGARTAQELARFSAETRALYHAFDAPIMRAPRPSVLASARAALAQPQILPWLVPGRSLDAMLRKRLSDPRLRQLFGRYATYVGGNPLLAPAVLGLVWQAEAAGVWAVQGGMARLAHCLAALFERLGGSLRLNTPIARIVTQKGRVTALQLANGDRAACTQVISTATRRLCPTCWTCRRARPKPVRPSRAACRPVYGPSRQRCPTTASAATRWPITRCSSPMILRRNSPPSPKTAHRPTPRSMSAPKTVSRAARRTGQSVFNSS